MATPELRPRPTEPAEDALEGSRMTLGEHLEELRTRLVRSAIALVVAFFGCWVFHEQLGEIALRPLNRAVVWLNADLVELYEQKIAKDPSLERSDFFLSDLPTDHRLRTPILMPRADSAGSAFLFYMRVCLYFGFFLSGSYILWQMWQFVAAGLYTHERKLVYRYFPASVGLFFGGILFGYFVMVPYAQYFLAQIGMEHFTFSPRVEEYFSFLKALSLALGIVFQLPIVMYALARLDLVEPSFYRKYRGHFIVLILVLAAVLTPPDPYTQLMMGLPMWLLYELGIVLAKLAQRQARSAPDSNAPDAPAP